MATLRVLIQENHNQIMPFFARERLLDFCNDGKTMSFSFGPHLSVGISDKSNDSNVMKIENILDINHDVSNYSCSMKLIGLKEGSEFILQNTSTVNLQTHSTFYIDSNLDSGDSGEEFRYKNSKRHQCGTCLKSFSRPSSLKAHSYVHTGEKPFSCQTPECGMKFNVFSNLKRHNKKCGKSQLS